MTAITQVPFILLVHFSMREGFSPYALVYGISLVQLLVLSVYNIVKGQFLLDLDPQARTLIITRSGIQATGFFCFVYSFKYVSPICALCLQGTTCVMNTSIARLGRACERQIELGYIVPAFIGSFFCLLIALGFLREQGLDIVEQRDKKFLAGTTYALVSGICLGIVSRISQAMSKQNLLPHESFMAFYAALFTCCCSVFLLIPQRQERLSNQLAFTTLEWWPFALLAVLTALKSLVWERGTMWRFSFDYKTSMHSLFAASQHADEFDHSRSLPGDTDALEDQPKLINLTLLQLPIMLVAYQLYSQLVDDPYAQMAHNVDSLGIVLISAVMCLCMGLLSYDDELILFY